LPEYGAVSWFLACANRLEITKKVVAKICPLLYLKSFSQRISKGFSGFSNRAGSVFQVTVM